MFEQIHHFIDAVNDKFVRLGQMTGFNVSLKIVNSCINKN